MTAFRSPRPTSAPSDRAAGSAPSELPVRAHPARGACPVTVVILTYNEEVHIERAVGHLAGWAQAVFVVDSHSDDRTRDLARASGARVFTHRFENYAKQREWALRQLPYETEWMLFLDADEIVSDPLKREIERLVPAAPAKVDGYHLKFRFYWMGRWLRHGGMYPSWILRLVRHERAWCNPRGINEHLQVEGETRRAEHDLLHIDLKSISEWIAKHNRYSTLEAQEQKRAADRPGERDAMARLFGTQAERKRWLREKVWTPWIPSLLRPLAHFVYVYVVRLGFLDGREGLMYHMLQGYCFYFMIEAKYAGLRDHASEQVNPPQALGKYDAEKASGKPRPQPIRQPRLDRDGPAPNSAAGPAEAPAEASSEAPAENPAEPPSEEAAPG